MFEVVEKFLYGLLRASIKTRLNAFYAALDQPALAQKERLLSLLGSNADTCFGREHGFAGIRTIDDYRRQVPIRPYRGFLPYIERMKNGENGVLVSQPVSMFGVTSGSSAAPKFIPVTADFTRDSHNAHLIWMYNMLASHRGSAGHSFSMVSPAEEGVTSGGIPYGSCSGKNYQEQSIPIRMMHPVPYEVFLIGDCVGKYHCALVFAMAGDLRLVNSVNPSSLVMLGKFMQENAEALLTDLEAGEFNNAPGLTPQERTRLDSLLKPAKSKARRLRDIMQSTGTLLPKQVWPNIKIINTWQGGNAPFYLAGVKSLWGDAPQRCFGLRATEGMFTVPLTDYTSSAPLAINSHFLEFIEGQDKPKAHEKTLLAHELEVGGQYRMVVSTASGLYRYDLADIVEVTGFCGKTPDVKFLHKAGGVLSLTGEKVCEDQVVEAVSALDEKDLSGFSVTLEMTEDPRYILALEYECEVSEQRLQRMGLHFDRELAKINIEYAAKRGSGRLVEPAVLLLEKGSYMAYRRMLVARGRPDGQVKPPHLLKPPGAGLAPVAGCDFFDNVKVMQRVNCQSCREMVN